MALTHSPSVVRNGLVFYYDMNNTQRSWKGKPITNVVVNSSPTTVWSVGNYLTSAATATIETENNVPHMKISGVTYDTGYPRISYSALSSTITDGFSVSYEAKGTPGAQLSLNIYSNGSTKISNIATLTSSWQRFTFNNLTTGFTLDTPYLIPLTTGATCYIRKIQIEQNSFATPYVDSTRSNTQAIVDLVGNNIITASSLTYDSDGTFRFASGNIISCTMTKASSITFSGWAKTTIAPASQSAMLFNAGPAGTGPDLYFYGGQLYWNIWDGAANPLGAIPASSNDGKYHNYVLVNDSSTNAKLYYDGNLLGTAIYRSATANTSFYIGGAGDGGYSWIGNIGMFGIHNRALTAAEVLQNFEATRSRYGV